MAEKITFLYPLDFDWDYKVHNGLKLDNGSVIDLDTGDEFDREGDIPELEDVFKTNKLPNEDIILVDWAFDWEVEFSSLKNKLSDEEIEKLQSCWI